MLVKFGWLLAGQLRDPRSRWSTRKFAAFGLAKIRAPRVALSSSPLPASKDGGVVAGLAEPFDTRDAPRPRAEHPAPLCQRRSGHAVGFALAAALLPLALWDTPTWMCDRVTDQARTDAHE